MQNENKYADILARLDKAEQDVNTALQKVGTVMTSIPCFTDEENSDLCDDATLTALYLSIEAGNISDELAGNSEVSMHKARADLLRAEMDTAIEAVKLYRKCSVPTLFSAIDELMDDDYFVNLKEQGPSAWTRPMPEEPTPYAFTDHLSLLTSDEVYRKMILSVIWSLGDHISDELVSVATELYCEAKLHPSFIILLFAEASWEVAKENNPEKVIGAHIVREYGWEIANTHPDDQNSLFFLKMDELIVAVGAHSLISQCSDPNHSGEHDSVEDLLAKRNLLASKLEELKAEVLKHIHYAYMMKPAQREKANEYLAYAALGYNKLITAAFQINYMNPKIAQAFGRDRLSEEDEAALHVDPEQFFILRYQIEEYDEIAALDDLQVLHDLLYSKNAAKKRVKSFDPAVMPPVLQQKDVKQAIDRSSRFRKMAFILCRYMQDYDPSMCLSAALALYKYTNLHPAVILYICAQISDSEERLNNDEMRDIVAHTLNMGWYNLATDPDTEKQFLDALKRDIPERPAASTD